MPCSRVAAPHFLSGCCSAGENLLDVVSWEVLPNGPNIPRPCSQITASPAFTLPQNEPYSDSHQPV